MSKTEYSAFYGKYKLLGPKTKSSATVGKKAYFVAGPATNSLSLSSVMKRLNSGKVQFLTNKNDKSIKSATKNVTTSPASILKVGSSYPANTKIILGVNAQWLAEYVYDLTLEDVNGPAGVNKVAPADLNAYKSFISGVHDKSRRQLADLNNKYADVPGMNAEDPIIPLLVAGVGSEKSESGLEAAIALMPIAGAYDGSPLLSIAARKIIARAIVDSAVRITQDNLDAFKKATKPVRAKAKAEVEEDISVFEYLLAASILTHLSQDDYNDRVTESNAAGANVTSAAKGGAAFKNLIANTLDGINLSGGVVSEAMDKIDITVLSQGKFPTGTVSTNYESTATKLVPIKAFTTTQGITYPHGMFGVSLQYINGEYHGGVKAVEDLFRFLQVDKPNEMAEAYKTLLEGKVFCSVAGARKTRAK